MRLLGHFSDEEHSRMTRVIFLVLVLCVLSDVEARWPFDDDFGLPDWFPFGRPSTTPAPPQGPAAPSCGRPSVEPTLDRIVGGDMARKNSWPWQVGLTKRISFFSSSGIFCGGSLINDQWILTAAHCMVHKDEQTGEIFKLNPSILRATLGAHDFGYSEATQVTKTVVKVIPHEGYKDDDNADFNDIALIKLSSPVKFTNQISPVCLPPRSQECPRRTGETGYITGWGHQKEGGEVSIFLRQVAMPVYPFVRCKDRFHRQLGPDEFCGGTDKGGKDSCQGDSGGPYVFKDRDTGIWTQKGVVSWGNGCARRYFPGVYTCIAYFRDWIDEQIAKN